jgi:hypothetical protein
MSLQQISNFMQFYCQSSVADTGGGRGGGMHPHQCCLLRKFCGVLSDNRKKGRIKKGINFFYKLRIKDRKGRK